jgi:hypothetical protein
MSAQDIDKGARWSADLTGQLQDIRVGLICLTPKNLQAPWILFEAGALSKTLEHTFVCPYLFALKPSDIQGPLAQFQATKAEKGDTQQLLHTINKVLGDQQLPDVKVDLAFEKWWVDLDGQLQHIPAVPGPVQPSCPERELLEEVLELVRGLTRELSADLSEIAAARRWPSRRLRDLTGPNRYRSNSRSAQAKTWNARGLALYATY